MAWSLLQSFSSGAVTTATASATPSASLTSGSKLIAFVMLDMNFAATAVPTSVKDANNNSFTLVTNTATGQSPTNFPPLVSVWVLDTPPGDAGTTPAITATLPAGFNAGFITVHEVSGLAAGTTAAVDGTPGSVLEASAASYSQPAYSSSAANELLYSLAAEGGDNNAYTLSGYTADANNTGGTFSVQAQVYYKNAAGGAESGTWSGATGNEVALLVLAFQLPAAAPAAGPPVPAAAPGRTWLRRFRHRQTALPAASRVTSVPVALTDAGTSAEALAVTSATALADAGTGTEALAATSTVPLAGAGAGSDALAVAIPVALTDAGTGTDTLSVVIAAAISLTDAGTGTDGVAAVIATLISLTDAATGSDGVAVVPVTPLSDAGTSAVALAVTAATALADAGGAADSLAVVSAVSLADPAAASDSVIPSFPVPLADAGTAADAITTASVIPAKSAPVVAAGVTSSLSVTAAATSAPSVTDPRDGTSSVT